MARSCTWSRACTKLQTAELNIAKQMVPKLMPNTAMQISTKLVDVACANGQTKAVQP